ncbi:TonB-dependent receptor [Chitinophaga sp. sic0106]|uniref:TonB-dependent receptor n=1 Tax=Chitinophaga sp. sic0106 TaxID=2854785 RepID=UPI001C438AA5|nr:TonB-dependent receptor [Chitinophaga sp. sic0106]MBV7531017.1 TonB-dependent receptor [Chitinophaga sp. sic0106]
MRIIIVCMLLAAWSSPVHAQKVVAKDTLTGVTVTGNHTERRIKESALPMEIVNREYIRRNMGGSLMKSLEKLPGIKSIGIGSGNSKPLIRGLGFNQVVVAEHGIKHEGQQWGADHGLEIDQFNAGQIEIVKGPAAFLFGADAIGGAIDIKSPAPPSVHTYGGSLDLTGKSNNQQLAISAQAFVRTNKWFMTARVTATDYGDYRVPADTVYVYSFAAPLHNHQVRNTAGRERNAHLSTGWIGKHAATTFYGSIVYNKSGFFANAHGLEPRRVDTELHDRSSRDIELPSQEVTHYKLVNKTTFHIGPHQLLWQSGYQQNFRQEWNNYVNHGYMPPVYPESMPTPQTLERQYDKTVWNTALSDYWQLGRHELRYGGEISYQRNRINGWSFLIPAFSQLQAGFYAYNKFAVTDDLLLHGALRYDAGKIDIAAYNDWFTSPIINGKDTSHVYLSRAAEAIRRFSSVNWSFGVSYQPGQLVLKANMGSSFRMPIAKELGANGVNYHYFRYERGDINLSPERSYQLDLGIGWNAQQWSVQLTPYFNYFSNYIYLNPTAEHDYQYGAGNQVFYYAQSKVGRYGAELQAQYKLWERLQLALAAEYLYNRQLSGSKKGYTLPFTPPPSALFSATYAFSRHTWAGVDYRITAAQRRIVPPERTTPGYQLLGLSAGTQLHIKGQPLQLNLQVQNLLNNNYLDHTSFYRLIALPEAGRNIVLSLSIPVTVSKTEKAI